MSVPWWKSLLSAVGLAPAECAPDYDSVHWLDFSLGQGFPQPLPMVPGRPTVPLPDSLLPGLSLVGQFSFFKTGHAQVAHQGGTFTEPLPRYPGFKAMVFVPVTNTTDPEQLWPLMAPHFEGVYRGALLACLGDNERNGDPENSAIGHLPYLKADLSSGVLDDEGRAFLDHLESAALFHDYSFRSAGSQRLSLGDLRQATSITLVSAAEGTRLKARAARSDILFLEDSRELRSLVEAYELTGNCQESNRLIHEATRPTLSQAERDLSVLMLYGKPTRQGDTLIFPCYDHEPLTIDLRERKLVGPAKGGQEMVEMRFNDLQRVDLDEHTHATDRRFFRSFQLLLSDGCRTLVFSQNYISELHEKCVKFPPGNDVYILHALPEVLGFDGSRIQREDLVPNESLTDLFAKRPSPG